MVNPLDLFKALYNSVKYNKGYDLLCILTEHRWETITEKGDTVKKCRRCKSVLYTLDPPVDLGKQMQYGCKCQICIFEGLAASEDDINFMVEDHKKRTGHTHVHVGPLKS